MTMGQYWLGKTKPKKLSGLEFLLFDVASSLDVPFGGPKCIQYILH